MTSDAYKRHRSHDSGFTLAEATLAMVVLSMAAAGVLLPFADGASVQAEGLHRSLAAGLANDLLERIIDTPFNDVVATWHGCKEDQGQVKDASGTTFTDPIYANYSRDVSCYYVYVPQQGGLVAANFVLASVRVHYRGQEIAAVHRLISQ